MRDGLLRILSIWMLALLMPMVVTGCNTMQGLGEDTQAVGEALEEEAEEEDDY